MKFVRSLSLLLFALPVFASAQKSIYDAVKRDPQFSILRKMLNTTGLNHNLSSTKPLTLIAPTDAAFKKLSPNVLKAITTKDQFGSQVVGGLVLDGMYRIDSFANGTAVSGRPLVHHLDSAFRSHLHFELRKDGTLTMNGVKVTGEKQVGKSMILIVDAVPPVIIEEPKGEGLHRALPSEIVKWKLGQYCKWPKGN